MKRLFAKLGAWLLSRHYLVSDDGTRTMLHEYQLTIQEKNDEIRSLKRKLWNSLG